MPDSRSKADYDARTAYKVGIKLNRNTDADIIKALDAAPNKQALIKAALRQHLSGLSDTNRGTMTANMKGVLTMATTYVFDRGSCYGEAEFLGNLDPNGEYTEEQLKLVRDLFVEKVSALVESYDPSLTWFPALSEVWGVVGTTEADPIGFRDWWQSGANGAFETALMDTWMEIDEENYQ